MKNMLSKKMLLTFTCFLLSSLLIFTFATRQEAENTALASAVALSAYGFDFRDYYELGVLDRNRSSTFARTLYRGTEYALVAGGCNYTRDIDLYIYDRDWNLIRADESTSQSAGISFLARYTGTYYIRVKMYSATSDGVHWCLVYGYR